MLFQESEIREREDDFYKKIIRLYLKHGSVDEVFRQTRHNLPISYPGMHHLIKRWGVVKSVGPNSKLSEAITFLEDFSKNSISVEKMYKTLPPSFKTSLSTIHRILHNVKMGVTRRYGTALVIVPEGNENQVLFGYDIAHKALTLPMTYSSNGEENKTSIKRVLQQEVYSEEVVNKNFPKNIILKNTQPFMFLDIADIKVSVYKLALPIKLLNKYSFSSYKVSDLKFIPTEVILMRSTSTRAGVKEIVKTYKKSLAKQSYEVNEISEVNLAVLRA